MVLATWFGCGYFRWAPGTIGSIAAILIAGVAHACFGAGRWTLLAMIIVLLGPGIWSATVTERAAKTHDPGMVVIDEVLGQWVTLLGAAALGWKVFVVAFVLFRIFDIWKPFPVRNFERLPEGFGIVTDDLAAGIYGALILYIGGALRLY